VITCWLPTASRSGRDGEIRTRDPLNPIQVRYQAALHPASVIVSRLRGFVHQRLREAKRFLPGRFTSPEATTLGAGHVPTGSVLRPSNSG
jgi:hypothetical protein